MSVEKLLLPNVLPYDFEEVKFKKQKKEECYCTPFVRKLFLYMGKILGIWKTMIKEKILHLGFKIITAAMMHIQISIRSGIIFKCIQTNLPDAKN